MQHYIKPLFAIALSAFIVNACTSRPSAQPNAPAPAVTPANSAQLEQLKAELEKLAAKSDGVVGVSALHLETGRRVAVRGDEWFPQASVRKLPVALQLMARVERGEESLERVVELKPSEVRVGVDAGKRWANGKFTLRQCLEASIIQSDNTAMDVALVAGGGVSAVMNRLREWGVKDVDVSRSSLQFAADYNDITQLPPENELTPARLEKIFAAVPQARKTAAQIRIEQDQRDSATPDGMTVLLAKLFRHELLKPKATDELLAIMRRTETGPGRLKGLLPTGTEVAHKTGSLARTCNDAGIITLPNGKGHIAISVFTKASTAKEETRERLIAEIARAVYDFFA